MREILGEKNIRRIESLSLAFHVFHLTPSVLTVFCECFAALRARRNQVRR